MAKFIRSELTLHPKVYKKLERKKQNEQVKEHLHKKWKLYAGALGIIIITTSTGLGVGLGVPWHEIFSNLNHLKLNKTPLQGTENMTEEEAFNAVLANNTKINDLKTNVKPSSFIAPSYTSIGSLTIKAKADGKYNGSVKIKITTIRQINLKDLNLNTSAITGKINMTEEEAFNAFLKNNSTITDLKDNVNLTFDKPDYSKVGSLKITAKTNTKYSGEITVTITAIEQITLSELNTSAITGTENMTQDNAFDAFLNNNKNKDLADLKDNVVISFTKPEYGKIGALKITAKQNTKYSGEITVTITAIEQITLASLNQKAISGTENMTQDDAFNAFLNNNKDRDLADLKDNVVISFTKPEYSKVGSLKITAKTNTKYSGEITITINAIEQTNLKDLNLNTTLTETITDKQKAFQAFLVLNQEKYPDLKTNVETGTFTAPGYGSKGSLIINAKANSKYTGTITVTINAIKQIALSELNTSAITGIENMTQDNAFDAFLNNNKDKNLADLKDNVLISFDKPDYGKVGALKITAKTNTKYSGEITITINAIEQTNLKDLNLNTTLTETITDKQKAFQAFLVLNQTKYPDLKDNTIAGTFTAPGYGSKGSLTINAKANSKYTGTITVTINAIEQTNLKDVIKYKEAIISEVNENQLIETVLAINENKEYDIAPNDLEVLNFNKPNTNTAGSATIKAVDSSKYTGSVDIKIVLSPYDDDLREIIKEIKSTPPKTLEAIEVWKKYFAYYSQEKLQKIISLLHTEYEVNKNLSDIEKKNKLLELISPNISHFFHLLIVGKDRLTNIRYDDFDASVTADDFDPTNKTITIKVITKFIWKKNNNITEDKIHQEVRTFTINFSTK